VKKYRLEILYREDSDNCESIEESIKDVTDEKLLEMSDEALNMTNLLSPLLVDSPDDYYSVMNVAIIGGCIVGHA
jgi:hypothetical protein